MTTRHASRLVRLFSALFLIAAAGSAQAVVIDLGATSSGTYSFSRTIGIGETFTDYVSFDLDTPAEVSSFIESLEPSIGGLSLIGIDHFTTGLERLGAGGYTAIASLTSTSALFDEFLTPGAYRLSIAGIASGSLGGLYSATLHVNSVPEAATWVMLLTGLGLVAYRLRRRPHAPEPLPTTLATA